ncbi:pullulanase [Mycobacterium sp.]|uniref:pullulanase n=1 Tax=Mycobacterium sp. TaxID=1785 RepID=UPI002D9D884B|nr:pullulanase [Mycobacterium sp.]
MEYCLGDADGSATMWTADPDTDVDGDGSLDAVGLDYDGDGLFDDAIADLDGDGLADHLVRDHGAEAAYFTDDGTGTWAVSVDRAGLVRWFGLDGVEHTGGPMVDLDADGKVDDRLVDADGDGLADRAMGGETAYVDVDADGRWDVKLTDSNNDGKADAASEL